MLIKRFQEPYFKLFYPFVHSDFLFADTYTLQKAILTLEVIMLH